VLPTLDAEMEPAPGTPTSDTMRSSPLSDGVVRGWLILLHGRLRAVFEVAGIHARMT
jgi:hypothetical protein